MLVELFPFSLAYKKTFFSLKIHLYFKIKKYKTFNQKIKRIVKTHENTFAILSFKKLSGNNISANGKAIKIFNPKSDLKIFYIINNFLFKIEFLINFYNKTKFKNIKAIKIVNSHEIKLFFLRIIFEIYFKKIPHYN
ncbi:hypothetical protein Mgra_00003974 [Meloidogyne graminicola]|uniref:Uncharacterized protein n=1 Tax=Meloidogyne graminicola TaxID=189291 RepID=A0A8S9ZUB3_9BILA|nr:hypothetical protein Mgra_00003974 [Meloidogyne graminicola]